MARRYSRGASKDVERGLFESRAKAQTAIAARRVRADELVVEKPSEEISADAVLRA